MNIGKRIHRLRNNVGLTQELLAEKLNISRQSVTKWERGDSFPDIERLVELSLIFGVTIDYLIKGKNEYSRNNNPNIDNLEDIKSFLCSAKKNTYAAYGLETTSSRLKSHDLTYENGNFLYLDSYFGGESFIGQEVLYIDKNPYWAMNYSGRVINKNFSADFLKSCLLAVSIDKPFRGPEIYQNGNFTYHCNVKGNFDWFTGEEEIFFQTQKVYECIFHGGIIK
ncbi:helix-turn-helix domain-containing protein [Thiospirochaeta perfilievii]|uniref:Helix-turn-helix domain-containing protein n=1 Tax=Thiospirochaeta perfilievii TaxID=252967 RepID=A0A5C1QDL8_9SPIO|nr:DUF5680 domain-containing protein [Thiospirochaeta perfilievii]QEN04746.1 helix-turn-helix domain-containing protein [Thiospirochaeta perfilievii]